MIVWGRKQKPRRAERFKEMEQLRGRDHGQGLEIWRHVYQDRQKTVKEGLKALMSSGNDFVENYDQEVSMGSGKDRNVHRYWCGVRLI